MILRKEKSLNAGPIYGTGEGVAHSKRWYVALVRMHHEKKVSERLERWESRISFLFNKNSTNGAIVAR